MNVSQRIHRYAAGWQRIVNVDYSPTVIRTMEKKYSEKMPLMKWVCADIFHLKEQLGVGSALFDIALDKGTLDALLTVKHDPWDPPQDLLDRMHSYMAQVSSVLAPGGAFLHITFAQPHFRKRFLETADFEVQTHRLDGGTDSSTFEYYLYRCVKRQISKSKSE